MGSGGVDFWRKRFASQPLLFAGPELFDHPAPRVLDPVEGLSTARRWRRRWSTTASRRRAARIRCIRCSARSCSASGTVLGRAAGGADQRRTCSSASSAGWRSTRAQPRTRRRSAASGRTEVLLDRLAVQGGARRRKRESHGRPAHAGARSGALQHGADDLRRLPADGGGVTRRARPAAARSTASAMRSTVASSSSG